MAYKDAGFGHIRFWEILDKGDGSPIGIKAHTLRIWERRYQLIHPDRTESNFRCYSDDQLRLLLNISFLHRTGLRISKIAKMTQEEMYKEVERLSKTTYGYENQTKILELAMMDFDQERFNTTVTANVVKIGLERVLLEILFPLLDRVGQLWCRGAVGPANEHFVSNMVRQILTVAIDSLPNPRKKSAGRAVMYLPEEELHELGLLLANYLLKKRGFETLYLGASLPMDELNRVQRNYKPDLLFTLLILDRPPAELQSYAERLTKLFPETQILIAGDAARHIDAEKLSNVQVLASIREGIGVFDALEGQAKKGGKRDSTAGIPQSDSHES